MALGIYFAPAVMSAAKYDECIARLKKAGAAHPAGRRYHACFGSGDKMQVFDVWDTLAQFEAFGTTLVPILQAIGVDPGQPMVAEMHNVIVPPVKAAKAAKTAARPRAKARPKKAGKRRRT